MKKALERIQIGFKEVDATLNILEAVIAFSIGLSIIGIPLFIRWLANL